MSKANKKVPMDVINILKSIMDYKVKPLRAAVDAGKQAALEEPRDTRTNCIVATFYR